MRRMFAVLSMLLLLCSVPVFADDQPVEAEMETFLLFTQKVHAPAGEDNDWEEERAALFGVSTGNGSHRMRALMKMTTEGESRVSGELGYSKVLGGGYTEAYLGAGILRLDSGTRPALRVGLYQRFGSSWGFGVGLRYERSRGEESSLSPWLAFRKYGTELEVVEP